MQCPINDVYRQIRTIRAVFLPWYSPARSYGIESPRQTVLEDYWLFPKNANAVSQEPYDSQKPTAEPAELQVAAQKPVSAVMVKDIHIAQSVSEVRMATHTA